MSAGQLQEAMSGLIAVLNRFVKLTSKEITVVFDGKKREGVNISEESHDRIGSVYSLNETADDIIMKRIKMSKTPADLTVITSDKQIISYVKRRGSKVMHSEHFELLVTETLKVSSETQTAVPVREKRADISLTEEEVSFWERLFTKQ